MLLLWTVGLLSGLFQSPAWGAAWPNPHAGPPDEPVPALVWIELRTPADRARVMSAWGADEVLAYDSLLDAGGRGWLLLQADPAQQVAFTRHRLALRVLDADARGAIYYTLRPRSPQALTLARSHIPILHEDAGCGETPDDGAVGEYRCHAVARATDRQAAQLARWGVRVQRLALSLLLLTPERPPALAPADVAFHPLIAEMMDQVLSTTVYDYDGDLSGEWPVTIEGTPYTIATRYSYSGLPIQKATQYAYEHLQGLGLATSFHSYTYNSNTWRNVVAEQPGVVDPSRIILVTAHIDDMPSGALAPGADDNASGSTGVLVAADILSQHDFRYTLRYVLFTGEEQGLHGSAAYAAAVHAAGENIAGVVNMDMIAYDSDAYPILDLHARSAIPDSVTIANTFAQVIATYGLNLSPDVLIDDSLGNYSDNKSFWNQGYAAILAIEDDDDFTPYYHTTGDTLSTLNIPYFTQFVRATVGTAAHLAELPEGELSGLVYEAGSGAPVAGAIVEAELSASQVWSTTTASDGVYQLTLPSGTYTARATGPWHTSYVTSGVTISPDQSLALDIPLQYLPCDPPAGVAFDFAPPRPWLGRTVVFTGSAAAGTEPLTYAWAFGDGAFGAGPTAQHDYAVSGVYTAVLTATNCGGTAWTAAARPLTVTERALLGLVPTALTDTMGAGEVSERVVRLDNSGGADLTWSATERPAVGWLALSSLSGSLPPGSHALVTATFDSHGLAPGPYTATLDVASNDPDVPLTVVPVTLTVLPPTADWDKRIAVNGRSVLSSPVPVLPGDEVEIVDWVNISHAETVTFTLAEAWTGALALLEYETAGVPGSGVVTAAHGLTWTITGLPGDEEYVLTKTFRILNHPWAFHAVTETLRVENGAVQASPRVLPLALSIYGVELSATTTLRSGVPGAVVTHTLWVTNTGQGAENLTLSRSGSGWPSAIEPSGAFTLPAGRRRAVQFYVTVPSTATATAQDIAEVWVRAGSGVTASQTLLTSVDCAPVNGASYSYLPSYPATGRVITLTGRVMAGTPPILYTWGLGDGSVVSGETVTHTYDAPGAYRAVMTATNCFGLPHRAAHLILVSDQPEIHVEPTELTLALPPGGQGIAALHIENPGRADLTWTLTPSPPVTWLTAAPVEGAVAPSGRVTVVVTGTAPLIAEPAIYTAALRITSSDPNHPEVAVPVRMTVGCEPVAGVDFVYAPTAPQVGQSVLFTGMAASGTARLPVTYTWNFGDGSLLHVGNPATHVFTAARAYTVSLTVANACPSQGGREKGVVVYGNTVYLPLVLK